MTKDDNLLDIQQFGDKKYGIVEFFEIHKTTLVVDMRERERLTTISHTDISQRVCGGGTSLTHNIGSCHRLKGLNVDGHQFPLGLSLNGPNHQHQPYNALVTHRLQK
jgi:hypothetical protein